MYGALVLDADHEKSSFMGRNFAGVSDNQQLIINELTAASGLSFYKLWQTVGQSALSDSGGAEKYAHAETISARQKSRHNKNHRRVLKMLMAVELGEIPKRWRHSYNSIVELTPFEEAELNKTNAETNKINAEVFAVSPAEIRKSVARKQPIETVIDLNTDPEITPALPVPPAPTPESETEPEPDQENQDDATRAKRLIEWNGYTIGLQYFPFDRRHNRTLTAGYGYFRKTRGEDGMALDVWVGPSLDSNKVFSVSQVINGEFDEYKIIIGVDTADQAEALYKANMSSEFFGGVQDIGLNGLEQYKTTGNTRADASPTVQVRGTVKSKSFYQGAGRITKVDITKQIEEVLNASPTV